MLVDVHCHLTSQYFTTDELKDISDRIIQNRIKCIIVTETCDDLANIAQMSDNVIPFGGLHPIQPHGSVTMKDYDSAEPILRKLLETGRIRGIGEIGLDYSPHILTDKVRQREEQEKVFRKQLELAKEFDVFVNVHSRQAGHYAINMIKEVGNTKVIMHAFDGKLKYVKQCEGIPWYFSIPGSVQRCEKTQALAKELPFCQILLESDSPALGPRKGEKATPLDLIESIPFIAQLRNLDVDIFREQMKQNSLKLLKLL